MNNYENFELEDFLTDESFVVWTLIPGNEQNLFWQNYLTAHPEKHDLINRAQSILLSIKPLPADQELSEEELMHLTEAIHKRTTHLHEVPRIKLYQTTWFKVACIILVLLSAVFLFREIGFRKVQDIEVAAQTAKTISYFNKEKSKKLIRLHDGTLVFLASESTLSYPDQFDSVKREVSLIGEAFFEVHKDQKWPFLVHSGRMVTKVLGTSFTVKAFPDQAKFSVVVNTGKVEVLNEDPEHRVLSSVIITPNQQVTLSKREIKLRKDTVSVPLMLSPEVSTRIFSFNKAPLGEIVAKLEQAYGVKITYDQQKYADATVTASLAKLPLDQKINMICKAIDATYTFDNGEINIK